jgi:RNA polymerase sigma factor (sigma-70 family)
MNSVNQLILDHMEHVENVAGALAAGRSLSRDEHMELLSIGYTVLTEKANEYDPKLNDRFWGFAHIRVKGAMQDYFKRKRTETRYVSPDWDIAPVYVDGSNTSQEEPYTSVYPDPVDAEQSYIDKQILDVAHRMIEADKYRDMLTAKFIDGERVVDIAEQQGVSAMWVSFVASRFTKKVRKELSKSKWLDTYKECNA